MPMAVPFFSGIFDQFAPRAAPSLSLDDLYQEQSLPEMPAAPKRITSVRDLSEEERKRLRRQAILQGVLALAAPGGQAGSALAQAALQNDETFRGAVDRQNEGAEQQFQVQQRDYALQRQRAEQDAAQGDRKLRAQGRLTAYQQVAQQDPELATEAENAARSGDDSRLAALLQAIPRRKAERGMGYDPADPFVEDRVKAKLSADADAAKRKAVLESLPAELKIKNDAELDMLPKKLSMEKDAAFAERQREARAGILWNPDGEGRDSGGERWKPDLSVINGRLTQIDQNHTDPKTGKPTMVDLGPAGHTGKPVLRSVINAVGDKETWMIEQNPETGQWGEMHPAPMAKQPEQPTRKESGVIDSIRNWWNGPDKTVHPAAPAPKAGGAPATPSRPSPVLDNPQGAPVGGKGQGPARSPLRGKAAPQQAPALQGAMEPVEAATQRIEKQAGRPLPAKVRAALKARLASGADEQSELQQILQSMPGGR